MTMHGGEGQVFKANEGGLGRGSFADEWWERDVTMPWLNRLFSLSREARVVHVGWHNHPSKSHPSGLQYKPPTLEGSLGPQMSSS